MGLFDFTKYSYEQLSRDEKAGNLDDAEYGIRVGGLFVNDLRKQMTYPQEIINGLEKLPQVFGADKIDIHLANLLDKTQGDERLISKFVSASIGYLAKDKGQNPKATQALHGVLNYLEETQPKVVEKAVDDFVKTQKFIASKLGNNPKI